MKTKTNNSHPAPSTTVHCPRCGEALTRKGLATATCTCCGCNQIPAVAKLDWRDRYDVRISCPQLVDW